LEFQDFLKTTGAKPAVLDFATAKQPSKPGFTVGNERLTLKPTGNCVMLRIRHSVIGLATLALAGCTSSSTPSWLSSTPPPPPTMALQFDSVPQGADVRTADGQTCKTPCTLAVPTTSQSVSFAMNGFTPQSVPVQVAEGSNPPQFQPNPVMVSLQSLPKPAKPKPHKPKPKVAARSKTAPGQPSIAAPEPAGPQDNVFPPPPQQMPAQQDNSFPPPPPPPSGQQ
jgi:PEGA domain